MKHPGQFADIWQKQSLSSQLSSVERRETAVLFSTFPMCRLRTGGQYARLTYSAAIEMPSALRCRGGKSSGVIVSSPRRPSRTMRIFSSEL